MNSLLWKVCWHQAHALSSTVSVSLQWRPRLSYVLRTFPSLRYALVHLFRRLRRGGP